ncbi:NAD(P)-dependent dehydrogenase (short-subunit alcohol dehydrogenase family) [Paraburkholderia sp. UCT70]|uniref:SDR family NAD(P)-dependent oxidoreductase n=1 Tax=Paraburkholderia sp. UCT70 TaxID=2991068 RepID=UPI003D23E398
MISRQPDARCPRSRLKSRTIPAGIVKLGLCRTPSRESIEGLTIVPVDVTDFSALKSALDAIASCDALVHAAGFTRTAPLGELTEDEGAAMWRIHVDAAAFLANALMPKMPAGGRIVLIGSRTANGAVTRSQYAATKAALVGMARSWAAELAPRGITANVVAPGATDTPLLTDPMRAGTPPKMPPIGRFVQPSEVAALTAFLLGAEAGAITGQQIVICGGASL